MCCRSPQEEMHVLRQELKPSKVFHTNLGLGENTETPGRDCIAFNIVTKAGNVRHLQTQEVMAWVP